MFPDKQRIAIAEACGWQEFHYHNGKLYGRESCWASGSGGPVPDYLSDLNAMHEAEKVLTDEQKIQFATILRKMVPIEVSGTPSSFGMIHATAAQRAEAFLRTINKWED